MEPVMIRKDRILLAGFSFYGMPFEFKDFWDEENEIGLLWKRFMSFLQTIDRSNYPVFKDVQALYEVHLESEETMKNGRFEVFVGAEIRELGNLPFEFVLKVLPPVEYAVFSLEGEEITTDWLQVIYQTWMPGSGFELAHPYNIQYYDQRFKGMDRISESAIDVYVPVKKLKAV